MDGISYKSPGHLKNTQLKRKVHMNVDTIRMVLHKRSIWLFFSTIFLIFSFISEIIISVTSGLPDKVYI